MVFFLLVFGKESVIFIIREEVSGEKKFNLIRYLEKIRKYSNK